MDAHRSEELIKAFYFDLLGGGMSDQTAGRYRDKLRFFLHAFIAEEWPRDLDRVDGEIIRDFLGSWFFQHVGGAKTDIAAYIRAFRRFYDFLYKTGQLSESELDDVTLVLGARDYFESRYEEYFNPQTQPWTPAPQGALAPRDFEPSLNKNYRGMLDRQLWMLVHHFNVDAAPTPFDFCLFLDYVASVHPRLNRSGRGLSTAHLARINQRFTHPDPLTARATMREARAINWFFHLGLAIQLLEKTDRVELKLTPHGESFIELDPKVQLAIMIDGLWNRLAWADLGPRDQDRVSEWAQLHRDGFAALLAELPPEREWLVDPGISFEGREALLAKYVYFHEVVEDQVLGALARTRIISFAPLGEHRAGPVEIKSITTTRFGRQVMRLFLRRAQQESRYEEHPLARLEESLLSY